MDHHSAGCIDAVLDDMSISLTGVNTLKRHMAVGYIGIIAHMEYKPSKDAGKPQDSVPCILATLAAVQRDPWGDL